jgi:hypothetical protein
MRLSESPEARDVEVSEPWEETMLDVFQANNVGVGLVSLQHTSSHEGL